MHRDKIKILESNDDTLLFESPFIAADTNGILEPRCIFSGVVFHLGEKAWPLKDGIVACWPVEWRSDPCAMRNNK